MSKKLLIVESPAKAKTISKYLGADFVVKSSVGHIRDLPKEGSAIKIVEEGANRWRFVPTYEISDGKNKVVSELKAATKEVDEIYLASDPDREGEAIAWHLQAVLERAAGGKPFRRVTYNEITKSAVQKAVAEPREIDMPLVDAQQARRILDRLVGYKVSPMLWKNIGCAHSHSLSAGRVQSVALRLLVERQREIDAFKPETFFLMGVEAKKPGDANSFVAKLARLDDKKPEIKDRDAANRVLLDLAGAGLEVTNLKEQPKTRHTLPPFTTSTLQQAASSVLGFSPGKTMKLAQSLYEQGHITYMRTDSVNISDQARDAAREFIVKYCGPEYYPAKANVFKSKADAQGAHEAIRPTHIENSPKRAGEAGMDAAELKLYDLIWRRFVASQMTDAKTTVKTIEIKAVKPMLAHSYLFTASATVIDFDGFLKIMKLSLKAKTKDGDDDENTDEVAYLPEVKVGDPLDVERWISDEKQTKGPSHYSEASLIKALEENGVGRPSTYAAIIETLKSREYAKTEKKKLIPQERGILVCDWLVKNMDSLFNVGYTAEMEAELDKVAEQGKPMNDMLSEFYVKFLKELSDSVERPPDKDKFNAIFEILSEVKNWKPAKKIGKRVYDDKAFVDSVREQAEKGEHPLSARQLMFLIRIAVTYADQLPDLEERLQNAGLSAANAAKVTTVDPELVEYTFSAAERIGDVLRNGFIKSLYDQYQRGRGLSPKQFAILARSVGDNCLMLEDSAAIREKLSPYVSGGFNEFLGDEAIVEFLSRFDGITEWRPAVTKGKRTYNDEEFLQSLRDQYARRKSLTPRQLAALKRMAANYKVEIPEKFRKDGNTAK